MHIHCHCPTKFRTNFQVPQFSPNWIFTVVTGRCPFIQIIARKQHFVLAQEWDYSSSAECRLVWQELLALFNNIWQCVARTAICSELHRWHPGPLSKWRWAQTPPSWSLPATEDCWPDLAWQEMPYWHVPSDLSSPCVLWFRNGPRPTENQGGSRLASPPKHNSCLTILDLASYHRRHFSEIAALLHALTQKEVPF